MFDINKTLNDAIDAAVQQATAPLLERIAALENQALVVSYAVDKRIAALENQALVVSYAVDKRIAALENNPAQGVDTTLEEAAANKDAHERQLFVLQHLTARIAALEKHTAVLDQHGGIVEYLDNQEWFWNKIRNFTDSAVEQVVENHTDMYDHSDFVTEDKLDDYVTKDSLRDEIEDVLNNATIRTRF